MRPLKILLILVAGGMFVGCNCGGNPEATDDGGGGGDGGGADLFALGDGAGTGGDGPIQVSDGGVTIMDDGGTFTCYVTSCSGKILECGDCVDNDGDGRTDWRDPECLGPCDNTEGPGLESGVGGTGGNTCGLDCYFDYGNGSGNDDCHWDHRCDPLDPEHAVCPYDPKMMIGGKDCPNPQSPTCAKLCKPLTPNGCDCFGCCTFPVLSGKGDGGAPAFVYIGALDDKKNSTCTLAKLQDPIACPPCTPVGDCFNDCGHCELCVGKDKLPDDCLPPDGGAPDGGPDGGVPPRCPPMVQPCGLPMDPLCPQGFYCITGCCVPIIG